MHTVATLFFDGSSGLPSRCCIRHFEPDVSRRRRRNGRAHARLRHERSLGADALETTAYASLRERDEALNAGFNAHIGKPFDPEQLIETITALVDAGNRAGASQEAE
jgi:Flp pilus assembly protein TadD